MPITTLNNPLPVTPAATPSTQNSEQKNQGTVTETPSSSSLKDISSRQEYNVAILQAHQDVSLSVKNEPLALLYKTAIEAINKELEGELGENAIEKGYESGLDISPEATANRILSLSTGLFPLFQQQHPELNEQEQAERFVSVVGGGIDQGFSEAREILDGLGVLKDDIAENITRTYDLVQEGLTSFLETYTPSET